MRTSKKSLSDVPGKYSDKNSARIVLVIYMWATQVCNLHDHMIKVREKILGKEETLRIVQEKHCQAKAEVERALQEVNESMKLRRLIIVRSGPPPSA